MTGFITYPKVKKLTIQGNASKFKYNIKKTRIHYANLLRSLYVTYN